MNKTDSEILFLDLSNEKYCENLISSLLNISNIWVDYHDEEYGYIIVDDIIKITYTNGAWEVSYFLEYGPLDKYIIFEIEQHALFSYQALKKCFNYNPAIEHSSDFPESEVTIGYEKDVLTREFVIKFYECSKIISSFYYGKPCNFHHNLNFEIIQNERNNFWVNLTFAEYINIKTELKYVHWLLLLLVTGYESISGKYDLYQIYTDGEIKIGLTDVFLIMEFSILQFITKNFMQNFS